MNDAGELVLMMGLRGRPAEGGGVVLTQKFVEGAEAIASRWPGPTTVLLEMEDAPPEDLDPVVVRPGDGHAFGVEAMPPTQEGLVRRLRSAGAAHATVFHLRAEEACRRARIPLVFLSETTLQTLLRSLALDVRNPIVRARRQVWAIGHERERRSALAAAAGLQCNGAPTFEAYRALSRRPLLFFDSRIEEADLANDDVVESRLDRLARGGPLRLVFSGRLIPIKGAADLVATAAELERSGVDFELDICGGGPMEEQTRELVRRRGLTGRVRFRGVLDYRSELTPFVAREADLFVCCHLQGDPSCTYLETMACGVPIAGYDNEALAGLRRHARVGWTARMGKPRELATCIAALDADRTALVDAARRSLAFAREHTFPKTMDRRVEHLMMCAGAGRATREAAWT